jgi:hypothetical protein
MARLSFRCVDELVRRVDAARGFEPREAWLRRAVEQALGEGTPWGDLSAPAEQPVILRTGDSVRVETVLTNRPDGTRSLHRSSSQVQRSGPVPKKGKT